MLLENLFWSYFSKACQYGMVDEKMGKILKYVFIKLKFAKVNQMAQFFWEG
jgi:hypothetical protein